MAAAGALPFIMGSDKGTSTSLQETQKKRRKQVVKPAVQLSHPAGSALTADPAAEPVSMSISAGAASGTFLVVAQPFCLFGRMSIVSTCSSLYRLGSILI